MSTTLKTLKISNGSETRRVTVQKKLTFNELTSLVAGLFNLSAFKIVYQDEENDKITIGSDDEFQEAIETQAKNGVLRLSVKLPSVPKPAEPAAPAPAPVPAQAKPTVAEQAPKPAVATEQAPPKNEGKQEQTNNNAQLPDFQQLLNDFLKTGKVDHSKLREVFSQVGELGKQTAKDASTNVDDVVRALLTSPLAGQLIGLFGEYENNMRQAFSGQPHHGGHHGHHGGRGRWFHHQQQQQQNNNNGMEQPQSNVHIHVQCDGCQVQPIVGNRHKCKTCPDYDLCDTCFAKKATIHDAAHEFETRQFAIEPVFHRGVTCDSCQTHPIVGNRYKCKTCPNYDLCDTCFAKKTTVHDAAHEFDKIDRPAIPNRFMWQGRRGPHCGGNWRQFQQQQQQQQQAPQQPGQPQPAQPQQQQQPAQPQQGFCGMSRHLGRFISDVSIQDGTIVFVGQKFVKTWRMKNEGSVAWPADTQLVFVGGDQLSEVVSVPVKAAKPGEEVEISVEMTTKAAGRYTSFWRLCADSQRFGHRVWCDVISQVPAAPAPVVAPVPAQPAVIPALSIHPPVPKPVVESAPAPAPAPAPIPAPAPAPAPVVQTPLDQATEQLVGMGFDAQRARAVLQSVNLDILAAVQILLS